jgi:hypothetical protein
MELPLRIYNVASMTDLPFIAGAYGLFLVIAGGLVLDAAGRVRRARRRLLAVDPRAGR